MSTGRHIRLEPFSAPPIRVPTAFAELDANLMAKKKYYIDCSGCENRDASAKVIETLSNAISSHPELVWNHWNSQDINLRRRIASFHGVDSGHVFITSGAFAGIEYCLRIFSSQKTKTGLLKPDWPGFFDFANLHRNHTVFIENFEFPFIIGSDRIARASREEILDLVLFANPMPVNGHLIDKDGLSEMLNDNPETLFVIDEADTANPQLQAAGLTNEYPNCIFLGSLSKFYGLAGLRIGYLITPALYAEHFCNTISSVEVSSIAVLAGNIVWDDSEYHHRTQTNVASSIEILRSACRNTSYELAATPHCFACYIHSNENDPKITLEEYGIKILEGSFFRLPAQISGGRFNLADPAKAIRAAEAIRKIHGR